MKGFVFKMRTVYMCAYKGCPEHERYVSYSGPVRVDVKCGANSCGRLLASREGSRLQEEKLVLNNILNREAR